ncbi:hypothetical protein FJ981_27300 [Mesorhizobium sp. B1-1-4]|nr:hypothetical protein FJ944_04045 [Mesorhizobium sp. B2-4-11]TPN44996.1 hypothetical protein FJ981_27300 [Mesorhizobium sp. B1-1-4]
MVDARRADVHQKVHDALTSAIALHCCRYPPTGAGSSTT